MDKSTRPQSTRPQLTIPDPLTACRRIERLIRNLPAVAGLAMDVPECRVGLGTWLRRVIVNHRKSPKSTIVWHAADGDHLPDDDMTVLIALSDGEVWTGFLDAGDWRFVSAELVNQGSGVRVTHWAPIPEGPKA